MISTSVGQIPFSCQLISVPKSKLPRIVRKRSRVHGYGVFAGERISKNTRIIDYAGELILNSKSTAREARYLKQGRIWVFRVNRRWSRDAAVGGNIARLINHSCRPNCWWEVVGTTIWIRASRTIEPGEELTYDYATVGDKTIQCRCRPGCRTKL
jgi:SET domain-containing protein